MDLEQIDKKIEQGRTKTGINGFDELIEGGIPKGSFVVVTGGPGTGKTILASQFIANGVTKFNEKCLFISVEQPADEIVSQASQFGWDFNKMENEGKLKIVSLGPQKLFEMKTLDEIKELVQSNHFDRIVIDSITSLVYAPFSTYSIADGADRGFQPPTLIEMKRSNVTSLIDLLKKHGMTTFGVAQKVEGMPGDTLDTVSEFKADGLFVLESAAVGTALKRNIQVKKLRKTKINGVPHTFEFTDQGISVKS